MLREGVDWRLSREKIARIEQVAESLGLTIEQAIKHMAPVEAHEMMIPGWKEGDVCEDMTTLQTFTEAKAHWQWLDERSAEKAGAGAQALAAYMEHTFSSPEVWEDESHTFHLCEATTARILVGATIREETVAQWVERVVNEALEREEAAAVGRLDAIYKWVEALDAEALAAEENQRREAGKPRE